MKNVLSAFVALMLALPAYAGPHETSAPNDEICLPGDGSSVLGRSSTTGLPCDLGVDGPKPTHHVVLKNSSKVLGMLYADLKKQTEFDRLTQFSVDFNNLQCVDAIPSEMEPKTIGACVVPVSAFQVLAAYEITVIGSKITVTVLRADVE